MRTVHSIVPAILIAILSFGTAAAGEQAAALREKNALSEFKPPESFLDGNFVADEVDPGLIFGKVKDFVKSRTCPVTWLIEEGERQRLQKQNPSPGPVEYTLYLEEDCPGKVTYYVFIDRSQANAAQWLEWRKQFHKSKAEPQYSAAKAGIEQASRDGVTVDGELRFVEVNGDLQVKKPEEILVKELKFAPIYDLKQGKATSK